ncbi:MAG: WD40 repeat domain-containing protein [Crocinitomicaceae bacterium]|nr:WD40 repeat domain-containing protein [Crocinitomicaceae bacterium]
MFHKKQEIQGHAGAIYTCTCDHEYIYSGSADKFVTRWNLNDGTQDPFAIKFEQSVYALEICERLLFVGLSDGSMHVFDLDKRVELKYFTQHTKAIFSIKYNPLKGQVYVGDADGNLSVWNRETLELMIYLPLDAGKIRNFAISPNGERFALSGQDGAIRLFEAEYFNEIATIDAHKGGATAVLFHPKNDGLLISGGKDAYLKLWSLEKNELLVEIPAHNFSIYGLVALNNGNHLASISRDKTIKIWKTEDLDFIQRLDFKVGGHRHSVNDIVKLDDVTFVTCGDDKRLIVWEKKES